MYYQDNNTEYYKSNYPLYYRNSQVPDFPGKISISYCQNNKRYCQSIKSSTTKSCWKLYHYMCSARNSAKWLLLQKIDEVNYTHPALRRRGDVAMTSLWTSQWRRRYVSNETPNDVSMERRQDVLVVRLHGVLLERHNDVLKGHDNDAPSLRLHDVPS